METLYLASVEWGDCPLELFEHFFKPFVDGRYFTMYTRDVIRWSRYMRLDNLLIYMGLDTYTALIMDLSEDGRADETRPIDRWSLLKSIDPLIDGKDRVRAIARMFPDLISDVATERIVNTQYSIYPTDRHTDVTFTHDDQANTFRLSCDGTVTCTYRQDGNVIHSEKRSVADVTRSNIIYMQLDVPELPFTPMVWEEGLDKVNFICPLLI